MEPNQTELNSNFISAVKQGDIIKAAEALEKGADLNTVTEQGNNALYLAFNRDKIAMFDWLLEVTQQGKQININHICPNGNSLVFEVVKNPNAKDYLQSLIYAKVNTNTANGAGMTPLMYAVAHGMKDQIEILLTDPNLDVNAKTPTTKTSAFLMATAASSGSESLEIVKMLVDRGADINTVDVNGKNGLLNALFRTGEFMKPHQLENNRELCKYLINAGIDLNYQAPSGMTAFWMACQNIKEKIKVKVDGEMIERNLGREIVEMLLDKGVDTDVWHSVGMSSMSSALHSLMMILGKNEDDYKFIERVISLGADLHAPDEDGNTPATYGYLNPKGRTMTLALGGDVNSFYYASEKTGKKSVKKSSVLNNIIITGGDNNKEIIAEMIKRGAVINFKNDNDISGDEPIMCALVTGAVEIFNLMLDSGQIDVNELIPLSRQQTDRKLPLVSILGLGMMSSQLATFLERKTLLENIKKGDEINKKNGVVSNLIDAEGLEMISNELEQIKDLEKQLSERNEIMFNKLISLGADVNQLDNKGRSPIFYANNEHYANLLINSGADITFKVDSDDVCLKSIKNNTDMGLFWFNKLKEKDPNYGEDIYYQLAFTEDKGTNARNLIKTGIINFIGDEEFNNKIKENRLSEINLRSNINYKDEDGNTPLLVASANNNTFLAMLYRDIGADINIANNNGETPLMHAIATENARLVKYLIDKGANVDIVTNEGKSILDFAEELDNKEILEKVKIALGHGIVEGQLTGYKTIKPR